MRGALVLALWLLIPASILAAQTSVHQRIGVERTTQWEADVEAGLSFQDTVFNGTDILGSDWYLAVDLLLDRTWSLGCSLPFASELVVGDDAPPVARTGLGDPGVSAGWTGRVADLRLSGSLRLGCPAGTRTNLPGGPLSAGSGRWSVGFHGSAAAIIDPVVLGLALSYEFGLSRRERHGSSWQPGAFGLGLSVTEVLNDALGYTLRLSQSLGLPDVYAGVAEPGGFWYAARVSFEVFHYRDDVTVRIGFSTTLGADAGSGRVTLSCARSIRSREPESGGLE